MTPAQAAQLLIGLTMCIYWARVIRLARKAHRTQGSAGFVPREKTGRLIRVLWQPIVLAWIAIPLLLGISRDEPSILHLIYDPHPVLSWVGAVVVVAGLLATMVCWRRMGKSWRMGINPDEKTELVVTGPYSYVRHPIYALSALMMVATMVVVPAFVMWIVGCLHIILLYWEATREETHLLGLHGEPYRDYCSRVRRFVPTMRASPGNLH